VPSFFTQNISELHKSVMRQAGIYILMRQALDNDLDRYLEYVRSGSSERTKARIRVFEPGRAIIVLPSGEQITTTFRPHETVHTSHTPTVRGLLARLAHESPPQGPMSPPSPRHQPELSPEVAAVYVALEQESRLSPTELAARCGCDVETAKQALVSFFSGPSVPTIGTLA
jgi:hypothetical protein